MNARLSMACCRVFIASVRHRQPAARRLRRPRPVFNLLLRLDAGLPGLPVTRSTRVGRVVLLAGWALPASPAGCSMTLFQQVVMQAGLIWLARSLYFHSCWPRCSISAWWPGLGRRLGVAQHRQHSRRAVELLFAAGAVLWIPAFGAATRVPTRARRDFNPRIALPGCGAQTHPTLNGDFP